MGSGCVLVRIDRTNPVCISALCPARESASKGQGRVASDDFGSSVMASLAVVCGSDRNVKGTDTSTVVSPATLRQLRDGIQHLILQSSPFTIGDFEEILSF